MIVHLVMILASGDSFLLVESKKHHHWDLDQKPVKDTTKEKEKINLSPSGSAAGCTECCPTDSPSAGNNCGCKRGPNYRIPYSYWLK